MAVHGGSGDVSAIAEGIAAMRRLLRLMLLVVVPLIAVFAGLYLYARGGRDVETENAYVKQNMIAVSAEISGRVAK
jgi:membrane fusion protein (multidrug efflux system)